jgi:conjugal transfer mating pair stabilization protein TraG
VATNRSLQKTFTVALKQNKIRAALAMATLLFLIGYTIQMQNKQASVDTKTYRPLLNLIAKAESRGNYNAYFGNASNNSIDFTSMTIAEVLNWQAEYIRKGSPSSAVGRYQILNTTLSGLVARHNISKDQRYDKKTQDELAVKLLERRGSIAYVNKELSRKEFAASIAKEWASLPKVVGDNPEKSYYHGDGLNKSLIQVDDVLDAIEPIKPKNAP